MAGSSVHGNLKGEDVEHPEKPATEDSPRKRVQCEGLILPLHFPDHRERIQNMEVRSDDIWLCGLPKSGTTWTQETVWCIANDADLDTAKKYRVQERFPYLEDLCIPKELRYHGSGDPESRLDSITLVEKFPSPRFVKSHLPPVFLPKELLQNFGAKIIYVNRNPRDLCISYYQYLKCVFGHERDFGTFVEALLKDEVTYLPYWEHVLQFWEIRHNPNVLFITYEEMKKNLKKAILKIAQFLGKTLDEQQVLDLTKHLSFESMKHNRQVNREQQIEGWMGRESDQKFSFMRCGQSGQWKDVMTESMKRRFQKWEEDHLRNSDYPLTLDQ